jgi:ABC-type uncharacterized transport system permease subunit
MMALRDLPFLAGQTTLSAAPLIIAGMGELIAERAGVINLGIEGMMLTGCFVAFATVGVLGSTTLGVIAAMLAACVIASLFALTVLRFRADQIVAGTAINFIAAGATATAWGAFEPRLTQMQGAPHAPIIMEIIAILLVILVGTIATQTRLGVIVTALGESPEAADAAGIPVRTSRLLALMFAAAMAGLAGAYLSLFRTFGFSPDQTGGRGFLVLALVIFARWRVSALVVAALFFGFLDNTQRLFQGSYVTAFPGAEDLFQMLPYLATLILLATLSRSRPAPAALTLPWPSDRS